jgi:hypothetical protein
LGGVFDVLTAGDGLLLPAVDVEWEHAARDTTPRARDREAKVMVVMEGPLRGRAVADS